jgi:hypothetical protein
MSLSLTVARFSASPHRVTAILGLEPTSVRTEGGPLKSGRPSPINAWELQLSSATVKSGNDHQVAIQMLMQLLTGREAAFRQVQHELAPERFLIVGEIELPSAANRGEHGLWLDAPEMELLARCGLGWGVDLNVR